jgi:hypothetical protein
VHIRETITFAARSRVLFPGMQKLLQGKACAQKKNRRTILSFLQKDFISTEKPLCLLGFLEALSGGVALWLLTYFGRPLEWFCRKRNANKRGVD